MRRYAVLALPERGSGDYGGDLLSMGFQVAVVVGGPLLIAAVVGQKLPQAVPVLQHVGLRLIFLRARVDDRSKAGVIVAQTPLPGKHAPQNAQVLVYMGAYQR